MAVTPSRSEVLPMTVYQALMLAISFAGLIIAILSFKERK
ncbi:putative holin-like toxin [Sporolactobacillus sp. STCC-11]